MKTATLHIGVHRIKFDEPMLWSVSLIVRACIRFRLPWPAEVRVTGAKGYVGECDPEKLVIRIRKPKGKGAERPEEQLDTLAHELAHLRHFEHTIDHEALTKRIMIWWLVSTPILFAWSTPRA